MKIKLCLRTTGIFLCALVVSLGLWSSTVSVHAQKATKRTAHPAAAAKSEPKTSANNAAYAAKVKEFTTESYFMTELVDHLPASDKVPSPDKILGYEIGAPGHLTYSRDLYRYYRELEKASPRIKVFTAPERSEEGKEQYLIAVGDEAAIAKLDRYKEITAKLADPRKISDSDAEKLIGEGKALYWASGSIHSPETGSCE